MKERKGMFRCQESQAILGLWSETDGKAIQEFSCVELGESGASVARYCLPKGDSKYVTCEAHTCPEGFYPVAVHMTDKDTGREGMGFSCTAVEGRKREDLYPEGLVFGSRFPG